MIYKRKTTVITSSRNMAKSQMDIKVAGNKFDEVNLFYYLRSNMTRDGREINFSIRIALHTRALFQRRGILMLNVDFDVKTHY